MGVPPLPPTSECLDWRGVCKNALQNLEPQGVAGKIFQNKDLALGPEGCAEGIPAQVARLNITMSILTFTAGISDGKARTVFRLDRMV